MVIIDDRIKRINEIEVKDILCIHPQYIAGCVVGCLASGLGVAVFEQLDVIPPVFVPFILGVGMLIIYVVGSL